MTNTRKMLTDQMRVQIAEFDTIVESEDPYEELFETPLEITVGTTLTVLLCTGGPHVEAVATLDSDHRVVNARVDGYWAGARESWRVDVGSPLWEALEQYAQAVCLSV